MDTPEAAALLGELRTRSSVDDRRKVAEALGRHPRGAKAAVEMVADPDPTVRANAAWSLGKVGSAAAVSALVPLLEDQDVAVAGNAAVADLGDVAFHEVVAAPDSGWVASDARHDSANAAITRWYDYGFTSHLLTPKARVYAVRTADGRFAKLRLLSYYCPGPTPGCITFEYVYQGDGSRVLGR